MTVGDESLFYAGTLTVRINLGFCQSCTGLTGILSCNLTQYFTCSPSHTTCCVVHALNNCSSCSHSYTLPIACLLLNWKHLPKFLNSCSGISSAESQRNQSKSILYLWIMYIYPFKHGHNTALFQKQLIKLTTKFRQHKEQRGKQITVY